MRTFFSFCFALFFLSYSITAQNEFTTVIHEFAEISIQAVKENDMQKRLALVHPNIIAMGGGLDSYKSILESELEVLKEQNIKILKAEFGAPGKLVKAGPELHCIVPQKLFLEFGGKEAEESTNLLAASLDEGETWKFVDLNHHDTESIKVFFPYYNDELLSALEK